MNKFLFIPSVILGLSIGQAHAVVQPPEPLNCPHAPEIQAVGISHTTVESSNLWFTGRRNQMYGTADRWTFVLGNIVATDSIDAYAKGTAGLASLSSPTGPMVGPIGKWLCFYTTLEGYNGIAITPPIAVNTLAKYIAR